MGQTSCCCRGEEGKGRNGQSPMLAGDEHKQEEIDHDTVVRAEAIPRASEKMEFEDPRGLKSLSATSISKQAPGKDKAQFPSGGSKVEVVQQDADPDMVGLELENLAISSTPNRLVEPAIDKDLLKEFANGGLPARMR
mmetsp:Transcript_58957/g.125031  ORF Transcript_58957/g.125031 Transcript_58957/m.125031 type:complete len:138 (-) Transcript_58957:55-468(-)